MARDSSNRMNIFEMLLFLVIVGLPFAFFIWYPRIEPEGERLAVNRVVAEFDQSKIEFGHQLITPEPEIGQMFTNVVVENLDGKTSILAADGLRGQVIRLSQTSEGWEQTVLNQDEIMPCPAHVTPTDLDSDGDVDYLVSCIGGVQPTNELCGRVVWLENDGGKYTSRTILDQVRRVSDAQVGDFDGDKDIDIVVAVFGGLIQGQILYLENNGQQQFTDYEVMNVSGAIHVPVADFDGDGDLDFAAVISQEEEEVWAFENEGTGFREPKFHLLFTTSNFDLGTAGMIATDLDQDGDSDLVIPVGDNLELINNAPQPWHGVKLLENKGDWNFEPIQIADIGGVYGVSAGDIDGDGDTDLAVVTMFNDWFQENAASVLWLENEGELNFKTWQIASDPIQLATVDCADVDGDGRADILTGSFHFRKPFEKFGGVDLFLNQGKGKTESEVGK